MEGGCADSGIGPASTGDNRPVCWGMVRVLIIAVIVIAVLVALQPKGDSISFGSHTFHVEVANDVFEQARGLSGRDAIGADEAMLFIFPLVKERTFWMKDMRFPIDIIWLRGGVVVGITPDVPPEPGVPEDALIRYPSPGQVDQVVEVAAGTAARIGIHEGDAVQIAR